MLNRHAVKRTCLDIVCDIHCCAAVQVFIIESDRRNLESDLEVTLRLTYLLTAGAPNCFTVYSHLAKGVKTDSKHPVMKLISSWET